MSPRRASGPVLSVIWWQDIPAQVTARDGQDSVRVGLPERFQRAIDRAAVGGGLAGTDSYLAHWRSVSRPCGPDLGAEVAAEAAALDSAYPPAALEDLVRGIRAARAPRPEPAQ